MTLRKSLLVLALAATLGGCGSIGGPKIAIKVYDPVTRVQADPAWPQVDWSLTVLTTAGIEALDSVRIAVRPTPNELQAYRGAAWADTAPDLLRAKLVAAFEDSGRIPAVSRWGGGGGERSDFSLVLEVRAFETDYGSGAPEAVIEVQARLGHRRSGGFSTHRFRQAVPGSSAQIPDMVAAFGQALSALSTDVVGWTLVEGEKLKPATPPAGSRGRSD